MIPIGLRLAARILPPDVRPEVLAELLERYAAIHSAEGPRAAAQWARRQPWIALLARVRWRLPADDPSGDKPRLVGVADDVVVALSSLKRRPGVTAAVIATVATGIASLAIIASLITAVLLRPLPYPDAGRLVWLKSIYLSARPNPNPPGYANPADIADWIAQNHTLTAIAAYQTFDSTMMVGTTAVRVHGAAVYPSLGTVLGIHAAYGRLFTSADAGPTPQALVLSDGFWRRYFNADLTIVGRSVTFAGMPVLVVGVLPALSQPFPEPPADLWMPDQPREPGAGDDVRGGVWEHVVARVLPDRTVEEARADMLRIVRHLAVVYPHTNGNRGIVVQPYRDGVVGSTRQVLNVLGGAIAIFLVIAWANVGHLLLVTAEGRRREFAVRAALGASFWQMARLLVVEGLILAVMGGALGLAAAPALLRIFLTLYPDPLPTVGPVTVGLPAIVVALGGTALAAIVSALPALAVVRSTDIQTSLKAHERALGSRRQQRLRALLIVTQLAMSTALLVGGGLLYRTLHKMSGLSLGFPADHLLSFNVALPDGGYPEVTQEAQFFDQLTARLRAIPGVTGAGATTLLPMLDAEFMDGFARVGTADTFPNLPIARLQAVTPDYLETLGLPVQAGRLILPHDTASAPPVAVVNAALEREYFPGGALGHQIRFYGKVLEIVGVVGDKRHRNFREPIQADLYVPRAQTDSQRRFGWLIVRTTFDPHDLTASVLAAVRRTDASVSVADLETMDDRLAAMLAPDRFRTILVGTLAGASIFLAAIGVYGVVVYTVTRGTREIAIRMALGADRRRTVSAVVSRVLLVTAIGIGTGVGLAIAGASLVESFLSGVTAHDPATVGTVVVVLFMVAVAAAVEPAIRASRIDPTSLLRAN